MISRFLPSDFDESAAIAVIAGRGNYPHLMVDRMRTAGVKVRLISVAEETDPQLIQQFPPDLRREVKVGQINKMLRSLRELDCKYQVMVGQIRPQRLFRGIHPDLKAFRILQQLKTRNAETIYGAIIDEIEAIGVTTLDARAFIDDQLATKGIMTNGKWRISDADLAHGIRIANEVARLDIGQGVVVRKGTVLCIEEFNGTDAMLRRAAVYKTSDKLFIKTVKPNQNYAIDVPVFGTQTIESMKEGGVRFAALAADKTIMLQKENVLLLAQKANIQILGF